MYGSHTQQYLLLSCPIVAKGLFKHLMICINVRSSLGKRYPPGSPLSRFMVDLRKEEDQLQHLSKVQQTHWLWQQLKRHTRERALPNTFHYTVVCRIVFSHTKAVLGVQREREHKALEVQTQHFNELGRQRCKIRPLSLVGRSLRQERKWLSEQSFPGAVW